MCELLSNQIVCLLFFPLLFLTLRFFSRIRVSISVCVCVCVALNKKQQQKILVWKSKERMKIIWRCSGFYCHLKVSCNIHIWRFITVIVIKICVLKRRGGRRRKEKEKKRIKTSKICRASTCSRQLTSKWTKWLCLCGVV